MVLRWVWVVTVLALFQSTSSQVCDWDWEMDTAQGLDPRSLDAGARRLSVLRDVRDMENCRTACCSEPACQLAVIGTPADGTPECQLVSCMQDGRDVCLLQPSTQFNVYRKKSPVETDPQEPQYVTEALPQALDARSLVEENSTNADQCRRPMKVGLCKASFPRFYYDVTNQSCRSFIYGGCENNGNNFESLQECEKACQGVTELVAEPALRSRSVLAPAQPQPTEEPVPLSFNVSLPEMSEEDFAQRCGAEPEVGPCRAALPRWFYNSETHTCQSFIYGGCRGNQNNYGSQENCMVGCTVTVLPSAQEAKGKRVAMEPKDNTEYCLAGPEPGPCRAAFPRFYYQPSTGSCHSFIYGGCQGNNNRYETLEDCMSQCDGQGQEAQGNVGKRNRWTPAFFLVGTLAVISVLILTGLIMITLHRSRATRRTTTVSDKEELLPQQGEHSSLESLSVPESPKTGKV